MYRTSTTGWILMMICLAQWSYAQAQSKILIDAVRTNDLNAIKAAIQHGADVNAYDDDSDNVLINAAMYASMDGMQLLLDNKANANAKNKFAQTALMLCTDDLNKMKLLLRYGANINDTARSGNTAFLIACSSYGRYEAVQWLIAHGADVYAKRWGVETALMRAAQFSDTLTIKLLLSKGLDINAHPWGFTPLMYAVRMGNWNAVRYLVNHGADVNITDESNFLAVAWAAVAGNVEAVNLMLPGTKDLNIKNTRAGMTALMWATYTEYDNPGIIRAFIAKGADVNAKADDGSTALTWALKKGNTSTVAALRKAGAKE